MCWRKTWRRDATSQNLFTTRTCRLAEVILLFDRPLAIHPSIHPSQHCYCTYNNRQQQVVVVYRNPFVAIMTTGSSSNNNSNSNGGQERDLEQPLLRSRTPTHKPPPRHAFLLSPNHRDEGDEPSPDSVLLEQQQQQQQQQPYQASESDLTDVHDIDDEFTMLPIMGRPFAASAKFWYELIPGSLLIGALSGFFVAAFLWTTQKCISLWLPFEKDSNHLSLFHVHGASPWLLLISIPSMGGLVSGLCFLLPKTPRLGACKTFLHNTVDLQADPWDSLFVIFSSLVVLATGGPLGRFIFCMSI
jgi:hypothetical protein